MIRTILRYDTIHTIYTQYRTIYKHLRYANIIWNFLHKIWYLSYRTYGQQCLRVSEDQNKLTGYQVCEILRYMILIVIFLHLVYILTKNLILKHLSIYRTIRTILQYYTIHTIRTLYRTIYEHLWYIKLPLGHNEVDRSNSTIKVRLFINMLFYLAKLCNLIIFC